MTLTNNLTLLAKQYPSIWRSIKRGISEESYTDTGRFAVEDSRSGPPTLSYLTDEAKAYIHSRYNPENETSSFVEQFIDIGNDSHVLFYGLGLGYHIEAFMQRYPNVTFTLYEPDPEAARHFLNRKRLQEMLPLDRLRHFFIESKPEEAMAYVNLMMNQVKGEIRLIVLPSYERIFRERCNLFYKQFGELLKNRKSKLYTDFSFEKRWTANSMLNVEHVLQTPNFLIEKKTALQDKPVVLVAAGPSLQEELEHLREIKDKGLAYIFSVGSAINPLINQGIYPDAAFTYDPTVNNQKVFEIVKEKQIASIPMVFGSSVGFETLTDYPGLKFHFPTTQDTVSAQLLRVDGERPEAIDDAPSIAVITLQILLKMGCKCVILVGQNLAYRGDEVYSKGIAYYDGKSITEQEKSNQLLITDVEGNPVYTSEGFNRMRLAMELYTARTNIPIINTTVGGAKIEGTTFQRLADVITEQLMESVVDPDWIKTESPVSYDVAYLKTAAQQLQRSYYELGQHFREMEQYFSRAERFIQQRDTTQLSKLFVRWDKMFKKITKNNFFSSVIQPMNRVHVDLLTQGMNTILYDQDTLSRGQKILEEYRRFITLCKQDFEHIKPLHEQMQLAIAKVRG